MLEGTYLGFTDDMKPMHKARIEKTLDKLIRYNGDIITRKEFVLSMLKQGGILDIEEDYIKWNNKNRCYTNPKTLYKIEYKIMDNEKPVKVYSEITKTEYDFGNYLIENNLILDEKIQDYITAEKQRKHEINLKQIEKEAKEAEKQKQMELEYQQFEDWLNNQAENYPKNEKYNILREIFLSEIGYLSDNQIILLVLIDNIDDYKCKRRLKDWLHRGNRVSKKAFYHITGIKLPVTDKGTYEILNNISINDYKGIQKYTKRKARKEKGKETFYRLMSGGSESQFQEVSAEPFNKYGLEMFIMKDNNKYIISEAKTGLKIVDGATKTEAIDNLKEMLKKHSVNETNKIIQDAIERFGMSPRYNLVNA